MTVTWGSASGATSGYQYRYSTNAACLVAEIGCDFGGTDKDWTDHGTGQGDTTLTLNDLPTGHNYFFQVRGRAGSNRGEASLPSDGVFHPPSSPAKLSGLTAESGMDQQVKLDWTDPPAGDNVVNYDYRVDSGDGNGWSIWQEFTTTSSDYTITGLTNGVTHSFQIRATNSVGAGPESDTVSATPSGPPVAPGDLRATPQDGSVRLRWNDPNDSNIDRYQFRYKSDGDFNAWADISGSDASTTDYTVSPLTNGTEYTFEVRAVDSDRAEGDQAGPASSATATPTTDAKAPSQMSNVQHTVTGVTGGSGGTVTFTWDDPSESFINVYQYRLSESSSFEEFTLWVDIPSTGPSTVTWAPNIYGSSPTVFYELRAVNTTPNPALPGLATAVAVFRTNTPGGSPEPPAKPTGFSAAAEWDDTNTQWDVVLSWTDPSDTAIDKYQYRQSTDGGTNWNPDWTDIAFSDSFSTAHSIIDVAASTTYTFQVRAVDTDLAGDSGNGASSSAEATTPGAPNAPTGLSATPTDDDTTANVNEAETQVVLAWSAGARITGVVVDDYEYRVRVSGDVSWSEWADTDPFETESVWSYTVLGLLPSTTYEFQVRANAGALNSDPSGSASATTETPAEGIPQPEPPTGLSAGAGNEQVTLTWANPNNEYIRRYRYRQAAGESSATDVETADWQQIDGSDKDTTNHTVTGLDNGTAYSFQVQAEGAGVDNFSGASDTATAIPRVPRPPSGGGGPSRDSVTAHNSDETIGVTIEKPASVTLGVAVVDQACNTAAPGGTVHLCVQASASGAVENLATSPAFMTIVILTEQWTRMEGAYDADPRRFFLSKRSSSAEAWANIVWCIDDPGQECYLLQETEQGGATVFVYNIVSFSQYAIRTVSVDGVGGGGRCVGINCRAVIVGGGGGTGRGPQHRLPATTRTPAPTPRPTVAPTVRPTVLPPTVTPTAVPPTSVPPTRVPPTALPPTPTEAPTPPVQVEAPTPPPPTPVDAPTLEPTEVTAALPPTAVAPAPTSIPPLVGEPEGNLPPWLLIVIIAAVLAVGGMGFLAFRLLRAQ